MIFHGRKIDREKLVRELRVIINLISMIFSRRSESTTIKCRRTRTNASGISARLVDIHAATFIDSRCRWLADDRMVLTLSLPLRRPSQTPPAARHADDNDVIISITKITARSRNGNRSSVHRERARSAGS